MIDRPIHVRIVSPITAHNFRPPAVLEALGGLGLKVSGSQIEEGPASIESEFEIGRAHV